jgi:Flp pilus assembly protein TadB
MRIADIALAVFTFCNSLRFLAYVPQIARAVRDQSGAQAISLGTWGLFLISHASAMAYALVNNEDWIMAFMFLANAIGCGAVLLITAWKRSQHRSRTRQCETTPTVLGVLAQKMGSSIRKAWLRCTFSRKKTGSWTDGPLSGF